MGLKFIKILCFGIKSEFVKINCHILINFIFRETASMSIEKVKSTGVTSNKITSFILNL